MRIGEHSSECFTHVDGTPSAHGNNGACSFLPSNLRENLEVISSGFPMILERNEMMCGK